MTEELTPVEEARQACLAAQQEVARLTKELDAAQKERHRCFEVYRACAPVLPAKKGGSP